MGWFSDLVIPHTTKYTFKHEARTTDVGAQLTIRFPNNRGVSVVRMPEMFSVGNYTYELTPILFHGPGMQNFTLEPIRHIDIEGTRFSDHLEIMGLLRNVAEVNFSLALKNRIYYTLPCNQLERVYHSLRNRYQNVFSRRI